MSERLRCLPIEIQRDIWKTYHSEYVLTQLSLAVLAFEDAFEREMLIWVKVGSRASTPTSNIPTGTYSWPNESTHKGMKKWTLSGHQRLATRDDFAPSQFV
jgi:hypothetical protein